MNDGFFRGHGQPRGQILYGRLEEENPNHPGTYGFRSSTGLFVKDAHVLSADADVDGNGENTKPRPGSLCVACFDSQAAQCFVLGFHNPPKFSETDNKPPEVGNPDDNRSSGDKVYKTSGGASILLKRGGATVIEGGPGTGVILNPLNNAMTLRASNFNHVADGYNASRGRVERGKTRPATTHSEEFRHQVGPSFDRVEISHGTLPTGDARRQLELAAVTVASSAEAAILKTRETYYSDGSWVGEGPKYQWGGTSANENAVLGKQLVDAMSQLIDILKALKVSTAWGPAPLFPDVQLNLENLKQQLEEKILSTYIFLTKSPARLF